MFRVELLISDETALPDRLSAAQEWLDGQRFEPTVFRYTFAPHGVVFQVDFTIEAEAVAFAQAFGGSHGALEPAAGDVVAAPHAATSGFRREHQPG